METRITEGLHHSCILRLYKLFTLAKSNILVMEGASRGELFDAIFNEYNNLKNNLISKVHPALSQVCGRNIGSS